MDKITRDGQEFLNLKRIRRDDEPSTSDCPKPTKCIKVEVPKKQSQKTRKKKFRIPATKDVIVKKKRKYLFLNNSTVKFKKSKNDENVSLNPDDSFVPFGGLKCSKLDANGTAILISKNQSKYDFDFGNDETNFIYNFKKCDLSFHIVDEIALEGLDGITLEALWKRLQKVFPVNLNNVLLERIWKMICSNKHISFYLLPEPRDELQLITRRKFSEIENSAAQQEAESNYKEIYPYCVVIDSNVKGSCSTFQTRKENNAIRRLTLDKALKAYGQKLVLVASQTLRDSSLMNEESDPCREITSSEYSILERIGRSRYNGELTHGKISLMSINPKQELFYCHKKHLIDQNLATSQAYTTKSLTSLQTNLCGIMHLTRFYNRRRSRFITVMERIANFLREQPNYQVDYQTYRDIFGRSSFMIKLGKTPVFRRYFKTIICPYRTIYPDAPKSKWQYRKIANKERQLRVLRLSDPYLNITAELEKTDFANPKEKPSTGPGKKSANFEFVKDLFRYIASRKEGATLQEIVDYFKVDYSLTRTAIRKLFLRNAIDSYKIDMGRQQSYKLVAKFYNFPHININLEPKHCELDNYVMLKALKGYNKPIDESFKMYSDDSADVIAVPTMPNTNFTINFDSLCCTVFLSDFLDTSTDEFKIFDIINKGRDRLLLAQSNLNVMYIGEWENFVLKRENFFKFSGPILADGFGKIICEYLMTLALASNIITDNRIIFDLENLPKNGTCKLSPIPIQVKLEKNNNVNYYNNFYYNDLMCKIYLFENLFDENHLQNQVIPKMRKIVDRVLLDEGKRQPKEIIKSDVKNDIQQKTTNEVNEKLLGTTPIKVFEEKIDDVDIQIFETTPPPKIPECRKSYLPSNNITKTERYLKRANSILELVNEKNIFKDYVGSRVLLDKEAAEGYDKTVCRKSYRRILNDLCAQGYIKGFKVIVKSQHSFKSQVYVGEMTMNHNHEILRAGIDELKMKIYFSMPTKPTITIQKKSRSPFTTQEVKRSILELKELTNSQQEILYKYDLSVGRSYGYSPKFVRMRVLHEFLFFLLYDDYKFQQLSHQEIYELCDSFKIQMKKSDVLTMPPVYCKEISWKMFIPPLPVHQNWPKGWALVCDVILRLPLSVFLRIFNCSYIIPELNEYLNHPIKRHFLLKYLPPNVKNVFFLKRRYIFHLSEIFHNLCYIGLLQLGPRKCREKEQIFVYFNQKASLLDTTTSEPGYNTVEDKNYDRLTFYFKTAANVEFYWSEMWRICMNTPLGKRKIMDGQFVTIENCLIKPAMLETLRATTVDKAKLKDNGEIPGDQKGAAGLDSSLWSYVRRNWLWKSHKPTRDAQCDVSGLKKEKLEVVLPVPIQYDLLNIRGVQLNRKTFAAHNKKSLNKMKLNQHINVKKLKFQRQIKHPKKRLREYYDSIDKGIMKKNCQARVDWDEIEDYYLRFFRITASFLYPIHKKQVIPYTIMRDVLHRINPNSKNKTSKAIQRRIHYLLLTDEIIKIMETNKDNLLNSQTIAKYFGHLSERKLSDSELSIAFIYLISYIKKHSKEIELLLLGYIATVDFFSHPYISLFELILDVDTDNKVILYKKPETIEDIRKDTIKSIIHCSMTSRSSADDGYRLFKIYREYPDELIKTSMTELHKGQFLSVNKKTQERKMSSCHLPLKFSYLYSTMKTTPFTMPIYKICYKKFIMILENGTKIDEDFLFTCSELSIIWENYKFLFNIPEKGIILNPNMDHNEVIEEISKRFLLYLKKIQEGQNDGSSAKSDEITDKTVTDIENIKNRTMQLIFRVPYILDANLELYIKKMKESHSNLEVNNYLYLMLIDLKKFALDNVITDEMKEFIDKIEIENSIDNDDELLKNLAKIVFAIQNLCQENQNDLEHKFELWEMAEKQQNNDDLMEEKIIKCRAKKSYSTGMDICIKRALSGDMPTLEEIKKGIIEENDNYEKRSFPHITDLTMLLTRERFPELDTDDETIEELKDHFVMQYPRIENLELVNLEEFKKLPIVNNLINGDKIERRNTIIKQFDNYKYDKIEDDYIRKISQYATNQDDITFIEELIQFIMNKKQFGATAFELRRKFSAQATMDFPKLLQFLCSINVIIRAGNIEFVYVHHDYQNEWLVKASTITSEEIEQLGGELKPDVIEKKFDDKQDSVLVKLTPWTFLDGRLNYEIFEEWLGVVLSRCLEFPNILFSKLCEQLCYMKPVDVFFLLEILEQLNCLEIYTYFRPDDKLPFQRSIVDERKATCLDDFEDIFIKARTVPSLYFGSFIQEL